MSGRTEGVFLAQMPISSHLPHRGLPPLSPFGDISPSKGKIIGSKPHHLKSICDSPAVYGGDRLGASSQTLKACSASLRRLRLSSLHQTPRQAEHRLFHIIMKQQTGHLAGENDADEIKLQRQRNFRMHDHRDLQ